jgi:hypothetical protein
MAACALLSTSDSLASHSVTVQNENDRKKSKEKYFTVFAGSVIGFSCMPMYPACYSLPAISIASNLVIKSNLEKQKHNDETISEYLFSNLFR